MRSIGLHAVLSLSLALLFATPLAAEPILKTISIDGNMAEWAEILSNPGQFGVDAQGLSLPSTDLDFMVLSADRDLSGRSAFTYDSTYLYLYVERSASSATAVDLWSYVDTDSDGFYQSGDVVVHAEWTGSNGTVTMDLYSYQAQGVSGDPLVDGSGFADGHDMPGSVSYSADLEVLPGGSVDGLSAELRIPWSSLNTSPGQTTIRIHVSTSSGTNLPSDLDDNMGGEDGGVLLIPAALPVPALGGWAVPLLALALVASGLARGRMRLMRRKS